MTMYHFWNECSLAPKRFFVFLNTLNFNGVFGINRSHLIFELKHSKTLFCRKCRKSKQIGLLVPLTFDRRSKLYLSQVEKSRNIHVLVWRKLAMRLHLDAIYSIRYKVKPHNCVRHVSPRSNRRYRCYY